MSDALADIDEIENPEAGAYSGGLWARARYWVWEALYLCGEPKDIATVGLSRRMALQCRNWLWCIEGIVRRLIVAAALALDLSALPPLQRRAGAARERRNARGARPPCFRLFAAAGPAQPRRGEKSAAAEPPRPYAHIPFPADDLLRLGAPQPRRTFGQAPEDQARGGDGPAPRRFNPLHRRGRITRWDPDYRGHKNQDLMSSPPPPVSPRLTAQRRRQSAPPISSLHRLPVSTDWRRVEEEWERVLPAPDIAARLTALLKVMNQPTSRVHRLARRLQTSNLAVRLTALPAPILRRPRLDRSRPPPARDVLAQAHALLRRDTS